METLHFHDGEHAEVEQNLHHMPHTWNDFHKSIVYSYETEPLMFHSVFQALVSQSIKRHS